MTAGSAPNDARQPRFSEGKPVAATLLSTLALLVALAALALGLRPWERRPPRPERVDWSQVMHLVSIFEERWDSEEMVQVRSEAASSLLARTRADEVEAVLSFFDELGMLLARRALDAEVLWYHFYWPAASYVLAANRLEDAPERAITYPYLAQLLNQLQEIQRARTPSQKPLQPNEQEVDEFLANEASPPSCEEPGAESDDGEVQMTPL